MRMRTGAIRGPPALVVDRAASDVARGPADSAAAVAAVSSGRAARVVGGSTGRRSSERRAGCNGEEDEREERGAHLD